LHLFVFLGLVLKSKQVRFAFTLPTSNFLCTNHLFNWLVFVSINYFSPCLWILGFLLSSAYFALLMVWCSHCAVLNGVLELMTLIKNGLLSAFSFLKLYSLFFWFSGALIVFFQGLCCSTIDKFIGTVSHHLL
jgi:hypothetical protein